jgi:hypothetical protein
VGERRLTHNRDSVASLSMIQEERHIPANLVPVRLPKVRADVGVREELKD